MTVKLAIPSDLLHYEILQSRKTLSQAFLQHYKRLQRGFLGEKNLEQFMSATNQDASLILFDCLYEVDEAEFQIDCLLLTNTCIFILEVKHFQGDYQLEREKLFHLASKKEIRNPMIQLERTSFLFKQLLAELNLSYEVHPYILFTNESFFLYGASTHLPMIFRPQIPRFLQKITANAPMIDKRTRQALELLRKSKKAQSRNQRLATYELVDMKRGVFCARCDGSLQRKSLRFFNCLTCEQDFSLEEVTLYAAATFQFLFPHEKIAIQTMLDWCGNRIAKNTLRRVLQEHLNYHKNGRYSFYTFQNEKIVYDIVARYKEEKLLN